jgi:uncharacterized protein (TIGR03437 family)
VRAVGANVTDTSTSKSYHEAMRLSHFFLLACIATTAWSQQGGGAIAGDYTTALGDANPYKISTITTDSSGNTYVVGSRQLNGSLEWFTSAAPQTDVFVSKLDITGNLVFTRTFGGKGIDTGNVIAIDPSGNIYIAGATTSSDFPLTKALQTQSTSAGIGFIIKLTADGSTILYSTYFGGTLGATSVSSLATDSKGNLYLTGSTTAIDFPHTAGMPFRILPIVGGFSNAGAIVASISAAGDKILYSGAITGQISINPFTQFNNPNTTGAGIAVDSAGNAYVAGNTNAADLPVTSGVIAPKRIGAFVAKINTAGTGLAYLTYLSAAENQSEMSPLITPANIINAISVDAAGDAYLGGATSGGFPTTPGSLLPLFPIAPFLGPGFAPVIYEGFLAKLKPDASGMVWATYLNRGDLVNGTFVQSLGVDAAGDVWASGVTGTITFPNGTGSGGPEFLVGLNATGSALTYNGVPYPVGMVAQSIAFDPFGNAHVAGSSGFVSLFAASGPSSSKILAFQSAAGRNVTNRISPGEVIAIYGPGIGPSVPVSATPTNGFYPETLVGVQVTINGVSIPLLYVSANQINAVVPIEIAPGAGATVRVLQGVAFVGFPFPVWIVPGAAVAFPTVFNQDGTVNTTSNPAPANSILTFYGTGWQSSFGSLADGQIATTAQDFCQNICTVSSKGAVQGPLPPSCMAASSQVWSPEYRSST